MDNQILFVKVRYTEESGYRDVPGNSLELSILIDLFQQTRVKGTSAVWDDETYLPEHEYKWVFYMYGQSHPRKNYQVYIQRRLESYMQMGFVESYEFGTFKHDLETSVYMKPKDHGRYSWGMTTESRKEKQKEAKETYVLRKEVTSILKREGYSEKEIAIALGIHESSVRALTKADNKKDETKGLVMDVMGDYITNMVAQNAEAAELRTAISMSRTIIEAMKANEPPKTINIFHTVPFEIPVVETKNQFQIFFKSEHEANEMKDWIMDQLHDDHMDYRVTVMDIYRKIGDKDQIVLPKYSHIGWELCSGIDTDDISVVLVSTDPETWTVVLPRPHSLSLV